MQIREAIFPYKRGKDEYRSFFIPTHTVFENYSRNSFVSENGSMVIAKYCSLPLRTYLRFIYSLLKPLNLFTVLPIKYDDVFSELRSKEKTIDFKLACKQREFPTVAPLPRNIASADLSCKTISVTFTTFVFFWANHVA